MMLEAILDKRRIFELYLNVIEWGNGVFGAEAAAQRYFGVSAARLVGRAGGAPRGDGAESALLRAQPRRAGPRSQDPHHPRAHAVGRVAVESSRRHGEHAVSRPRRTCAHLARSPAMPDSTDARWPSAREPRERVQDALADVTALLRKHRLVEGLVHEQFEHAPPGAARERAARERRHAAEQGRRSSARSTRLHPADIAYVLEALPLDERLYIWDLVTADARRRDPASRSRTRSASRSSPRWTPRSSSPPPRRSTPTRSPSSRPTCRRR